MGENARLVRAYVDETGDRGTSAKSSPFFAFAAVVVGEEHDDDLRAAVRTCHTKLGVPPEKPLHWNEHVKKFSRRQYVTSILAGVPDVSVNYVIFEKAAIPTQSSLRDDQVIFYNYAAGILLERILLTAKDWHGGPRKAVIRYSHVRGFDHLESERYFDLKRERGGWVPYHLQHGRVRFMSADRLDGLQAADQYAGMLSVAIRPNEFDQFEPQHLLSIRHQLRRVQGQTWGYGFKVMALPETMTSLPWWPTDGL
jgi:hypothetical protein